MDDQARTSKMVRIKCKKCKKNFLAYPSRIRVGKKFCSLKCYSVERSRNVIIAGTKTRYSKGNVPLSKLHPEIMRRGSDHVLWKGPAVGYRGLHYWLQREKGRPKKCVKCGRIGIGRMIQWANKDGRYRRVSTDYIALCASCHKIHDLALRKKSHGKI